MDLHLARFDLSPTRTFGQLAIDGVFQCYTLEDSVREDPNPATPENEGKVYGDTAIPPGRYQIALTFSARAKAGTLWTPRADFKLPELLEVPGFTGIRIHAGNNAKNTLGCIMLGQHRTTDEITQSRAALVAFLSKLEAGLKSGPVYMRIEQVETSVA